MSNRRAFLGAIHALLSGLADRAGGLRRVATLA